MNKLNIVMEACYQYLKHFIQGIGKVKSMQPSKEILSEVKLVQESLTQTNVKPLSRKSEL